MSESEAALKTKALRWLKQRYPDAWIYKSSDRFTAGVPDILICFPPDGRLVACELKRKDGVVSKIQQATLDRIEKAGGLALVVRSLEELKSVL